MENKDLCLSGDEEKGMVGILYNHLAFATTMELFGELGEKGLERVENLRITLGKLLKKYDLAEALPSETFLLLGLTDFLNKEELVRWSEMEGNKHMQNRAKFFIEKLKK